MTNTQHGFNGGPRSLATMLKEKYHSRTLLLVLTILFGASLSLAFIIGDIGFQGDDWWEFSWPYWFTFPQSTLECIKLYSRPIEGLYYVLLYESFGFNRFFYTLTALLLLAGSCAFLVRCLQNAFPCRISMSLVSGLFAFFLAPVSNLIYMWHTDNSRLANLFFWCSVYGFQKWVMASCSWTRLTIPAFFYLLASFTYENSTLMIFGVPLLLWPVYLRGARTLSTSKFVFRVFGAIIGLFAMFVIARFLVFGGGAVKQSSLIPPISLLLTYAMDLAVYLAYPFTDVTLDPVSWLWGVPIAIVTAVALFHLYKIETGYFAAVEGVNQTSIYVAFTGLAFLVLGLAPYLLAGYTSCVGFTSQSRIYSSASYGVAILLGLAVSSGSNPKVRFALRSLGVVYLCLMAVFLSSLRNEWQEAHRQRNRLCASLLDQVPGVAPNTTFLFLNLQSYITKNGVDRAVVFQGVEGLNEWIKMLYGKRNINAYFIYPNGAVDSNDQEYRQAAASKSGVVARGSIANGLIPLDSLLLFKRESDQLRLINELSQDGNLAAIEWHGISKIASNKELILLRSESAPPKRSLCGQ
ncbi:MAG: hypothetical protein V1897_02495 [Pseudomonadota bacterium]